MCVAEVGTNVCVCVCVLVKGERQRLRRNNYTHVASCVCVCVSLCFKGLTVISEAAKGDLASVIILLT